MFEKIKKKIWIRKILKEDQNAISSISCDVYLHEDDKKAMDILKKIPFFDKICSKFISFLAEPVYNVEDMSSKIIISEAQLPKIYAMVKNISRKLGIDIPSVYLELDRDPNAYTYGDKSPSITITSGLLECLEEDEIYAVLAHECGHIACHHVLYRTMGRMILNGSSIGLSFLDNNLITTAITASLKLAFCRWMRCSELSADRAAAICCGSAKPVIGYMMRLSGGTKNLKLEINDEAFLSQANDYQIMVDEDFIKKAIEFSKVGFTSHPLNAVRAAKIAEWTSSGALSVLQCLDHKDIEEKSTELTTVT